MEFGAVSYIHAGLQLGYFIHKGHSATRLSGMKQGFEAELRLDGVSLEQTINTDRDLCLSPCINTRIVRSMRDMI